VEDDTLVARPDEVIMIERVLIGERPGTVLLHGPSGSGKSTLMAAVVDRCRLHGRSVLLARASEASQDVDLAGLVDLLGDVPDDVLDVLPAPQASALRAALLRETPESAVDPRALRAGVHGVLAALSVEPLLVAVDDTQWVDPATLHLLEHAVRRLPAGRLGLLLVTREPEVAVRLRGFSPVGRDVTELTPRPLTLPETDRLARSLGLDLSTAVVRDVHEASGGNPMWATELLASHRHTGRGRAPASLEHLVENRVAVLPPRHRAFLVAAALAGRPEPLLVARAAGVDDAVLGEIDTSAELRRMVAVEDGLLRFAHPLFASAVLRLASPTELRMTHARLAEVEVDEVTRARHLALSEPAAAASVAALDTAVDLAMTTGRRAEAARLARLAVALTGSADPSLPGRRLRSAETHWALGMPDEALADLSDLDADTATQAPERARLLQARILADVSADSGEAAYAGLRGDPHLSVRGRAETLAALADLGPVDDTLAAELATAARDLDAHPQPGDGPVRTVVATALADVALRRDDPEVVDLLRDAVARESRLDEAGRQAMVAMGLDATPRLSMARHLIALDDFEPARTLLDAVRAEAESVQDEVVLGSAGLERGHLEIRAGGWSRAELEATAARERFLLVRLPSGVAMATVQLGALAALRGDEDRAASLLGEAERRGRSDGLPFAVATARGNLGRMALAAGRLDEAIEHLEASADIWAASAMDTPLFNHFLLDRAEALVLSGHVGSGLDVLGQIDRLRAPTPRLLSGALRVRATAAADAGGTQRAVELGEAAVAALAATALPLEAARADLVLGRTLRRARRKADADLTLARAEAGFAALGAATWLDRAKEERARIGLRRATGLTETERRVAELAADGLRNTDIARALFLATKTVEATLARVYRKLGIRGRAELARALDATS